MKRVLVQAGHQRPLQPGHESQTGAAGEAELVASIQHALIQRLDRDAEFHGVPMPGRIDDGVKVDAALFLHADGSDNRSAGGYSVGFPPDDVNRRLAHLIAEEIEKLPGHPVRRGDNNTADMAQYYGFNHVSTPGPEVLVEHGFVSNPDEHKWLTQHIEELAHAEHNALRRFFGLDAEQPQRLRPPRAKVAKRGRKVTPSSVLHAAPRARVDQAVEYMLAQPNGGYSAAQVRSIVHRYFTTAAEVGLDPLLVVAQMAEETGHLTSFWSQPPRRNPAGIGVTGEDGVGLSFANWKTAIHAHVGRLLAYSMDSGSGTQAQIALIDAALRFRPLPDSLRGSAKTLRGLAGSWAADPQYAAKLAQVANDIRAHGAEQSTPGATISEARTYRLSSPLMKGDDIEDFQQCLNACFKRWKIDKRILEDGAYGTDTRDATEQVCKGLGIVAEAGLKSGVSPELRGKIADIKTRTPDELARARSAETKSLRSALRKESKGAAGTFDGKPVAPWIIPSLQWARAHGWTGRVSSGFRTCERQKVVAAEFARSEGKTVAQIYPNGPCASNHVGTEHPRGAVDVTEFAQLDQVLRTCPHRPKLVWGGPVIGDEVHFSATGH